MKKLAFVSIVTVIAALGFTGLHAEGAYGGGADSETRVLIVGDSWAEFTWIFGSLDLAFDRAGFPDIAAKGDVTAIGGSTASQWREPGYLALIDQELAANPEIDVIHLCIGGNDFLYEWNTSMTLEEEEDLFQRILTDIGAVIEYILIGYPGIQIVFCGYDYPNLEEIREWDPMTWFLWFSMGMPDPVTINDAMIRMSELVIDGGLEVPSLHVINHMGLMQWVFGYPGHGIPPRSLPLPGNEPSGYEPLAGGDPTLPSPPEAMLDGIHLGFRGYNCIALSCTYYFYHGWFTANP